MTDRKFVRAYDRSVSWTAMNERLARDPRGLVAGLRYLAARHVLGTIEAEIRDGNIDLSRHYITLGGVTREHAGGEFRVFEARALVWEIPQDKT